ncbi:MAG: DUF4270 domain-containing protein [Tannerellaceae bacterium]|jgi:hypothetical protein|nr:DUF4270 domain-containing protein [Tannerellaceae bacterium]
MKIRLYITSVSLGVLLLSACDDEMGTVGPTIQPEADKAIVYTDTFQLKASTIKIDSLYARSVYGLLGEFYDPLFGNLKSDYICQFYASEGFRFEHTPIDGKIDSVMLNIFYNRGEWVGDSLAPMEVTVFPVVKQLERNFYTHLNPQDYVDMQNPLGQQAYTPRNLSVSDSIWNLASTDLNYYYPQIKIALPEALGQKFYDETLNHPATFTNQQRFNEFFPGLYVTNTFGSGNITTVSSTAMLIYYRYLTASSSGAIDSVINTYEVFTVTPEVIQLNNFYNTDISHLLEPNDTYAYLKTPAGVFTRLTLPIRDILSCIKERRVNSFYLSLKAMPQEDWEYALAPPAYLLLLPEDSLAGFFSEGKLQNSVTSFVSAQYAALTYDFGNLSPLLKYLAENEPDKEELNFLVVPVEMTTQQTSTSSLVVTSLNHYLKPSGLRLRKDGETLRFQVVSSKSGMD